MSESSLLGMNNRGVHKMGNVSWFPNVKQNTEFQKFCVIDFRPGASILKQNLCFGCFVPRIQNEPLLLQKKSRSPLDNKKIKKTLNSSSNLAILSLVFPLLTMS